MNAGDFTIKRDPRWAIERDELRKLVTGGGAATIIDTRERREFDGETPYGERRGGHLPGAVHLHYRDLLDSEGQLLGRDEVRKRLVALGVSQDRQTVVYCTGGVRSASPRVRTSSAAIARLARPLMVAARLSPPRRRAMPCKPPTASTRSRVIRTYA